MWLAMTGVNFGGGAGVCGVFLTNLDEIRSLDHSLDADHTTINNKKTKRKKNNQKERLSLRFRDLDDC